MRATQGALVAGDLGVPVTGVSIDSRALGVGEAFFAIHGHRLDGHAFLADAAARGAACLVVHALPDDVPANVPLVLVEDTTRALGRLAACHRARFTDPGGRGHRDRNGKTTTKELIAGVLGTRWAVLKPERQLQQPVGASAHAAAAHARAPGRWCSRSAPTSPARSRRWPRWPRRRSAW